MRTKMPMRANNPLLQFEAMFDATIAQAKQYLTQNNPALAAKKYIEAGDLCQLLGNIERFLECYEHAAKLNNVSAKLALGEHWLRSNPDKASSYIKPLAEAGNARAQTNLARIYHLKGMFSECLEFYQMAVAQNYIIAQYELGLIFFTGETTEKDLEKAIKYFHSVLADEKAKQDTSLIQKTESFLGEAYQQIGEVKLAEQFYKSSAKSGYPRAQYLYGMFLEQQNRHREARNYFKLAADQEEQNALYKMGILYEAGGEGLKKDLKQAKNYYKKAATQKNCHAFYRLGWLHALDNETQQALECYKEAANQGLAIAQYQYACCAPSVETRIHYFQLAAEQKHAEAQVELGLHYLESDKKRGFELFQNAAKQNAPLASYYLSTCYLFGLGVEKNGNEAMRIMQELISVDQNLLPEIFKSFCHYHLGQCYQNGWGGEKNLRKALSHYEIASTTHNILLNQHTWMQIATLFANSDRLYFNDISKEFQKKHNIPKEGIPFFCLMKSTDFFDNNSSEKKDEIPGNAKKIKGRNDRRIQDIKPIKKTVDNASPNQHEKNLENNINEYKEKYFEEYFEKMRKYFYRSSNVNKLFPYFICIIKNLKKSDDQEYNCRMMDLILSVCVSKTQEKFRDTIAIIRERKTREFPLAESKQIKLAEYLPQIAAIVNFIEEYLPVYHALYKTFLLNAPDWQQENLVLMHEHMDKLFADFFSANTSMKREFSEMLARIESARERHIYRLGLEAEKTCSFETKIEFYKRVLRPNLANSTSEIEPIKPEHLHFNEEEQRRFIYELGVNELIKQGSTTGRFGKERNLFDRSSKMLENISQKSKKISAISSKEFNAFIYLKQKVGLSNPLLSGFAALKKICLNLSLKNPYLDSLENYPLTFDYVGQPNAKKLSIANFSGTINPEIFEYVEVKKQSPKIQLTFHKQKIDKKFTIFSLFLNDSGMLVNQFGKTITGKCDAITHLRQGIICTINKPQDEMQQDPSGFVLEVIGLKRLLAFRELADNLKSAITEWIATNPEENLAKIYSLAEKFGLNKRVIGEELEKIGFPLLLKEDEQSKRPLQVYPPRFFSNTRRKSETNLCELPKRGRELTRRSSESDSLYLEKTTITPTG